MTGKFSLWCLVLGVAMSGTADTHYVDINSTNPVPPYTSWETAAVSIQDAVDVATFYDTVLVNDGQYHPDSLSIRAKITLRSANGAASTSLSGPFDITFDPEAVIDGFTFFDSYVAIALRSRNELANCNFVLSDVSIDVDHGSALTNCFFEFSDVSINMDDSELASCFFESCDDIELYANHYGVLKDCVVISDDFLDLDLGYVIVEQCVFHGGYGDIDIRYNVSAVNSVFSFYEANVDVRLSDFENCTLSIKESGGYLDRNDFQNCIVDVDDTIIAGKRDFYSNSCSPFAEHGVDGNINLDPKLVNIGSGVLAPLSTSPCIDAGLAAFDPDARDVIGNSRFIGSEVDMGAVEYRPGLDALDERVYLLSGTLLDILVTNSPDVVSVEWYSLMAPEFVDSFVPMGQQTVEAYIFSDEADTVVFKGRTFYGETCYDAVEFIFEPGSLDPSTPIHYVSPAGRNISPYTSWATAANEIQDAVTVADDGDTVMVTNGTYTSGVAIDDETGRSRVAVWKDIVLTSVNGPEFTHIVGEPSPLAPGDVSWDTRSVYMATPSGIATVEGFSLTNGYARSQAVTLSESGGGVLIQGGGTVSNCYLIDNVANEGGGAAVVSGGTLVDCRMVGNTAKVGGGGGFHGDEALLIRCNISDNLSETLAGGVHAVLSEFDNCLISRNEADHTGAGWMDHSMLHNCTIISNVDLSAENLVLGNCTINNSILAVSPLQYPGVGDYGSVFNYSRIPSSIYGGVSGSGNLEDVPLFVDPLNGDYQLASNSPCINAGSNALVNTTIDLAADPRTIDFYIDMGAYEFQGTVDSDIDGMSDGYETYYFNNKTNAVATNDTDQDGQSDGEEYVTGMSPVDPLSLFSVTHFSVANNTGNYTLEWVAKPDRLYSILWTPTLTNTFQMLAADIEYPVNRYTDTIDSSEAAGFYRVEVRLEP